MRSQQEYMQIQAQVRAIKADPTSTPEQIAAANDLWQETMAEHAIDYPLITGTITYTRGEVKEANRHSF